eukprot:gene5709-8715_t
MPPARWSCSNCGIVNKPSNTQCYGCATKCPVFDVETWTCPDCQRPVTAPTCPGCQYRQPLSKEGVPQIFEGVKCAFTGIIPRSLPHWSLWKEWQLAEQRGARPLNEITTRCTHLIFKEGFERSDKVRKARNMACNMKIVCSEWFYQSVALGVRLDEDPYTLSNPQTKLVASSVQGASKDIARIYQDQLSEIAAVTYSDGGKVLKMRPSQALTPEGDFMWLVPPQQTQPLFQDCTLVFSPSVDAKLKGEVSASLDGSWLNVNYLATAFFVDARLQRLRGAEWVPPSCHAATGN